MDSVEGTLDNDKTTEPKPPVEQQTVSKNKKQQFKKSMVIGVAAGVLLVGSVAIICGLLVSGKMYAGFKESDQKVLISTTVCDNDTFNKYNSAINQGSDSEAVIKALNEVAEQIKRKSNYQIDPNCQFILWQQAFYNTDYDKMNGYVTQIEKLNGEGKFISGNLIGIKDIATMKELGQPLVIIENEDPSGGEG
jgi:hypothetical protein